jgi:hypothetical protein
MKRRKAARHNVYVIELDGRVLNHARFRAANPERDITKPCVYVGCTGLTPEKRFEARQQRSVPILEKFRAWLDDMHSKVLPKSPIGTAVTYCRNQWSKLTNYLQDGRLVIASVRRRGNPASNGETAMAESFKDKLEKTGDKIAEKATMAATVGFAFIAVTFVVPAGLYVPLLRVTFSRGLVITVLRYVITLTIFALFGLATGWLAANLIFFLPSMWYWPSSLGKDGLIVCFMGIATYGFTCVLRSRYGIGLLSVAFGLVVAYQIGYVDGLFSSHPSWTPH